jgi:hypothetical protein
VPCYISTYQTGCQELFQLFLTPLNAPSGSDVQARPPPPADRGGRVLFLAFFFSASYNKLLLTNENPAAPAAKNPAAQPYENK